MKNCQSGVSLVNYSDSDSKRSRDLNMMKFGPLLRSTIVGIVILGIDTLFCNTYYNMDGLFPCKLNALMLGHNWENFGILMTRSLVRSSPEVRCCVREQDTSSPLLSTG